MKRILLSLLCIAVVYLANAQSQFGIINYALPEGWYARQSGNDIEIEKKGGEKGSCKITLFQQVNSVVDVEKKYTALWTLKTKSNGKLLKSSAPVRTEDNGWISFSGSKTTAVNTEAFYTLSDGSKTAMILVESSGGSCADEIDAILATINIPDKEANNKTKSKSRKVRVLPLKSLKALVN